MTKQVSRTTSRMFPSCLKLLVLHFLFLSIESHSGQILPAQNLSLVWKHDFKPELTWQPTQQAGCKYRVESKTNETISDTRDFVKSPPWSGKIVMEGGYVRLTVVTLCGGDESKAAVYNKIYPEIVNKLECYVISSSQSRCTWKPVSPDLRFFYALAKEDRSVSHSNNKFPPLQECPSYIKHGDIRTGCVLEANVSHSVTILFNGTVNGNLSRNSFTIRDLKLNVKPPPLEWNVIKVGGNFSISWSPPDIDFTWEYMIEYSECGKSKVQNAGTGTSYQLVRVPQCPYSIKIRAVYGNHSTPWSDFKSFDADPNAAVLAAIIIPLVFAGLAVLTFVCCRKNKDHIFPKVPQPRDFLSDIYDNNNKSTIRDLYIPAEEEENCKITLVMDPQNEYNPGY